MARQRKQPLTPFPRFHINPATSHILLTNIPTQCCSPDLNGGGGWGVFQAILGWNNTATYGSVISYCLYWVAVIAGFIAMRYKEVKGHWPLMKAKAPTASKIRSNSSDSGGDSEAVKSGNGKDTTQTQEKHLITPTGSN